MKVRYVPSPKADNDVIDVRAPGCAGNLFLGDYPCTHCGELNQITFPDVRAGYTFFFRCYTCQQVFEGNLTQEARKLLS